MYDFGDIYRYFPVEKTYLQCVSDYLMSLTATLNVLISCFLAFGCLREEYASLSDDLWAPEPFTDLTAFKDFAVLLFIVHEHWGVQPIHIVSCHPLCLAYHTFRDRE